MAAVASSTTPTVYGDLTNAILRLPEKDFWKLVSARLNLPQQRDRIVVIDANEELSHIEYWAEECLIDELFLRLASTK
jgi:hypothetical protein